MIVLKEIRVIKPPFHATIEEVVTWVKPTTVSVMDSDKLVVGGLMVDRRLLVCSHLIEDDSVKVQFSDSEKIVKAIRIEHKNDMFLSCYALDESDAREDWVGLPNRTEETTNDTFLFSYVHDHHKDYVVQLQAVPSDKSKAYSKFLSRKGVLKIDGASRHSTYPIVDRFGYLFGIGVGESCGEFLCQTLTLKGSKL